ncbi:MAG TPA: hypothetical protein VFJ43_06780, partial [Bacteroidia bacterium]|nr:hypothetical protein [Bacteroidia bacterium]
SDRIRLAPKEVYGLLVFIGGMMFQYFSFRSEIREALAKQESTESMMEMRLKNAEDAEKMNAIRIDAFSDKFNNLSGRVDFLSIQPADKPKPIVIPEGP